jgi:hypothetical protein
MMVSWLILNTVLATVVSEAYGLKSIGDNYYLRFIFVVGGGAGGVSGD